jgi:transcription elongation factor SPT4
LSPPSPLPLKNKKRKLTHRVNIQRFLKEGCPNCEDFLHLAGSMDAIIDCTSQVFEGLITLADPARSWVAKWQRLDGYVRGVYAIKVSGQLPDEIVAAIEDEGRIRYIPYEPTSPIMTCGGALLTSRAGAMDLLRRQTDILVG